MKNRQLIDLQEHCFRLRSLLAELDQFEYNLAMDWLNIAAGVESVKVTTTKYDDSVVFCGNAFDYEDKRSELLSHLATKLTIFNFVWGSFESIVEALKLPRLPKYLKRGKGSNVDRVIWFLKENYGSEACVDFYENKLYTLRKLLNTYRLYSDYGEELEPHDFATLSGEGLHIVRKIRNRLAHGSATMPIPDSWGEGATQLLPSEYRHLDLIDTSIRIILFTIQMLLLSQICGKGVTVECLLDEDGFTRESTAEFALQKIHIQPEPMDCDQLSLFD